VDKVPLSDLCDQYGLHPTIFHRWQKAFFENGAKAFEKEHVSQKARLEKKIADLESKISRKNDVLSELMEEHVALKKVLGKFERRLGSPRYQGFSHRFCKYVVNQNGYSRDQIHQMVGDLCQQIL